MKRANWGCCIRHRRIWESTGKMILNNPAVIIRACRHRQATQPITPATGITQEVSQVRREENLQKNL